jgi:hypothetical protein
MLLVAAAGAASCTSVLGYPDRVSLDELPTTADGGDTDGAARDGATSVEGGVDANADAKDAGVCTSTGACPVAAYDFEEGAGTTAHDSSGNKNDGALVGVTWAPGKVGKAAKFNGANVLVQMPTSPTLDISGTHLTLAFWAFVVDDQTRDHVLLTKPWAEGVQNSPPYQYAVEFNHAAKTFVFFLGLVDGAPVNRTVSIPASPVMTWTHVAFTYDGAMQRGYVNGVEVAQQAATGTMSKRGTRFRMGVDCVGGQGFSGRLDSVRIYDKTLTAAEIAALRDGT